MTTIYAATTNPGKLREFAESASGRGITVLPLPGLKDMPEPVEDSLTFTGNAAIKALAYSLLAPGLMVFADDSGLEVATLAGQPGVRSARFADDLAFAFGSGTKDERNNQCLLSLLRKDESACGVKDRRARFVCSLVLARDGEVLLQADGLVEGEIVDVERGENGFGYDPLFLLPDLGRTAAELDAAEKWAVSHRGRAFRALLAKLDGSANTEQPVRSSLDDVFSPAE